MVKFEIAYNHEKRFAWNKLIPHKNFERNKHFPK